MVDEQNKNIAAEEARAKKATDEFASADAKAKESKRSHSKSDPSNHRTYGGWPPRMDKSPQRVPPQEQQMSATSVKPPRDNLMPIKQGRKQLNNTRFVPRHQPEERRGSVGRHHDPLVR